MGIPFFMPAKFRWENRKTYKQNLMHALMRTTAFCWYVVVSVTKCTFCFKEQDHQDSALSSGTREARRRQSVVIVMTQVFSCFLVHAAFATPNNRFLVVRECLTGQHENDLQPSTGELKVKGQGDKNQIET